jgi:hypothetical protein
VEAAPTAPTFLTDQQKGVVDGYQLDNARSSEKSTDI